MNFDLSQTWRTVRGMLDGLAAALPRIVLALVLVTIFYLVAKAVRALVRKNAMRRGEHRTLELAIGRLAQGAIVLLGLLIAFTAAFPSFTPADLIGALGIGGVAIGFAFKDIFQNFLAGLLILVTRPFVVGDQIRFKDYEGTVEDIQTRATYLKTYDGRRVVIPNGELYTNAVTVNTAFPERRWQYDIGIGYGDDVERAREIVLQAMRDAEDVSPDPKADVILVELAESTVNLRARWWTKSRMADGLNAQDRVLTRIKQALTEAGIDLPFPTQQVLFHDQTEATDGDRRRQREGWPAGTGDVPEPRGVAAALALVADQRHEAGNGHPDNGHPDNGHPENGHSRHAQPADGAGRATAAAGDPPARRAAPPRAG
jgi:small-conductance mechanosensitive channel